MYGKLVLFIKNQIVTLVKIDTIGYISGTYRAPDVCSIDGRYVYYMRTIHTYRVPDMCSTYAENRTDIL